MKTARLAVLGVALASGLGAAYFMMGSKPEPERIVVAPPPIPTDALIVAARDIGLGTIIASEDVRWQTWPKDQVPAGTIARSHDPNGMQAVVGKSVQTSFTAGEPIRPERLGKGAGMSAVLPSGMRAVAIDLSDQGKSAAGGFILPNDRVDVIRSFRPEGAVGVAMTSETILSNIRVLAIGQNMQEKAGERIVIGGTATLELTPAQTERAILAQRTGQLTLALRSAADSAKDDMIPTEQPQSMTIIRSGNASQTRVK